MEKYITPFNLEGEEDQYVSLPLSGNYSDLESLASQVGSRTPLVLLDDDGEYYAFYDASKVNEFFQRSPDTNEKLIDILHPEKVCISSDIDLQDALILMSELNISSIPVVEGGKPKGILTLRS